MNLLIMVWKLSAGHGTSLEPVRLETHPTSLDAGSTQLPGGAYTTFRTFGRFRMMHMADHFQRLEESAALVGRPERLDRETISSALHQVMAEFPAELARIRITLDLEDVPGTIYFLIEELHVPSAEDYARGVKIVTRSMARNNPKAKLTGFIGTAASIRQELPQGINEAVMIGEDGCLLEGLSSNFFAIKDGAIYTAEAGVLSGITRSMVLNAISEKHLPLCLQGICVSDIGKLNEAFLTSASRGILPIVAIDNQPVGDGHPGPITRLLMDGYEELVNQNLETV